MKKLVAGLAVTAVAATAVSAGAVSARQPAPSPTMVDVALAANAPGSPFEGLFDTVIAAATCGSLDGAIVDALSVRGQRTLFAPIDPAFDALGLTPANVCSLPAGLLADVLSYHVANGQRDAASVLDSTQIRMLNGDRVAVEAADVQLVDGLGREANIIVTDVFAGNGVIHAIDSVLLPPGFPA